MVAVKAGGGHGLWKVLVQKVGANGISYGIAGDSLVGTSEPLVLNHPKTAGIPIPDRTTIDFTGGDTWITSFQYGITSLGSFEFTIQDFNSDLIALVTGTNADQTTNDELTELTEDVLGTTRPIISLVFIWRIQSFETATFGQTWYIHTVVPQAWVAPKGEQNAPSFQSPGDYAFQVTPSSSTRKIHIPAFGANLNATNNVVSHYHVISPYPLYMITTVATAASPTPTAMVASYKPVSEVVGAAGSTKNEITAFTPATAAVTVGVADTVTSATATASVGNGGIAVAIADVLTWWFQGEYEAL